MKRLDSRIADLEAKHTPTQRVVEVRRDENQSDDEAIIAAGFDPNDDQLFVIISSCVSPRFDGAGNMIPHCDWPENVK